MDVWFRWPCLFRSIPGDRGRSRVTSPCTSALATYRGSSRIRNRVLIGPYSRTMPKALRWSYGGPGGGAVSYERGTPVHFAVDSRSTQASKPSQSLRLVTQNITGASHSRHTISGLVCTLEGLNLHFISCNFSTAAYRTEVPPTRYPDCCGILENGDGGMIAP